jgi:class 3 adenylate cyclase
MRESSGVTGLQIIGRAVNEALRLLDEARPGEIVCCPETTAIARGKVPGAPFVVGRDNGPVQAGGGHGHRRPRQSAITGGARYGGIRRYPVPTSCRGPLSRYKAR